MPCLLDPQLGGWAIHVPAAPFCLTGLFSHFVPMYQGIGLRGRALWAGHVGWDRLTPRKRGPLLFIRKAAEQLFEVGA